MPSTESDRPKADEATLRGQAVYSPATLALYDLVVLGVSNARIWRCPTKRILALYDRFVTDAHLDVGVGTGFYLDHCRFPTAAPRIGLLDLNTHSLAAAARRLARYAPTVVQADVLQELPPCDAPFGSISLTYLLHCLPGAMPDKAVRVFDHLVPWLRPDGRLFGATLLSEGVERSMAARALMRTYNRKGFFSNEGDSLAGLRQALSARFAEVELDVVGCAALFYAAGPRTASG